MGAWGSGHFDNDAAGDLVTELVDAQNWSVAEAAFDAVLSVGDDHLEEPESSTGIAAAAIVAHQLGRLIADVDPEDSPRVATLGTPPAGVVAKAKLALSRIKKQSELADLWEEAGDKDEWLATVEQIESVL